MERYNCMFCSKSTPLPCIIFRANNMAGMWIGQYQQDQLQVTTSRQQRRDPRRRLDLIAANEEKDLGGLRDTRYGGTRETSPNKAKR